MKSISNIFSGVSFALGLLLIGFALTQLPANESQQPVLVIQAIYTRAGFFVLLAIASFVFSGVVMLSGYLVRRNNEEMILTNIPAPARPGPENPIRPNFVP